MDTRPPIRFRKLRIAWSVGCGIACVLMAVLWVRSYWWYDRVMLLTASQSYIEFVSQHGRLVVSDGREEKPIRRKWRQSHSILPDTPDARDHYGVSLYSGIGFKRVHWIDGSGFVIPHWFVVSLLAILALLVWPIRRFSLRTLLIAMTLVAVILGMIAVSN